MTRNLAVRTMVMLLVFFVVMRMINALEDIMRTTFMLKLQPHTARLPHAVTCFFFEAHSHGRGLSDRLKPSSGFASSILHVVAGTRCSCPPKARYAV